jgi:hypothetical protein
VPGELISEIETLKNLLLVKPVSAAKRAPAIVATGKRQMNFSRYYP